MENNLPEASPENKKRKIVIAEIDISQQARDVAEENMAESKESLKGIKGLVKRIWKHNLAHEYYRQKEIAAIKKEIKETGNLYAGEEGGIEDHEDAMRAIVERFQAEFEDELLRGGEEKKVLEDALANEKSLKDKIRALVLDYATDKVTKEDFIILKNDLFKEEIGSIRGGKDQAIAGKGEMYADNLLEIADQVKQDIAHNRGLDGLDLDFEVTVGRAKTGVDTEANYSTVDRVIEKIRSGALKSLVNETALASAVAIAHAATVKFTLSASQRAAKLTGPLGLGLSALVGGTAAGFRENKRIKEERAQHAREMAKGGKRIETGSARREEMEKYRQETREANELIRDLKASLDALWSEPDPEKLKKLLESITEIDSRIAFSDRNKVDLVSFSDPKKVEQERTALYIATAEAKVFLEKNIGEDWSDIYKDKQELRDLLAKAKEERIETGYMAEKTAKDEAFQKMKKRKVAGAVAKGVGIGLGLGVAVQESVAYFGSNLEGIASSKGLRAAGPRNLTALEYLRRSALGQMPRIDSTHLLAIPLGEGGEVRMPDGFGLSGNPDGSFDLVKTANHEILEKGLKFNNDGTLTAESARVLEKDRIFTSQFTNHIKGVKAAVMSESVQPIGGHSSDLAQGVEKRFTTEEYLKEHENLFSKVKREAWANNDTAAPNKNELKLQFGGVEGTGIDQDGNFVFNIKHMAKRGSFLGGKHWNPEELMRKGKMKLLISLSQDTQGRVVEIPIDTDGNAVIDPKSEIGKIAFDKLDGKAKFLGRFAEVAVKDTADEKAVVLATHVGKGVNEIVALENIPRPANIAEIPGIGQIAKIVEIPDKDINVTVFDLPADYSVDLPYVIPVSARRPLERLGKTEEAVPHPEKDEGLRIAQLDMAKDYIEAVMEGLKMRADREKVKAERAKFLRLLEAMRRQSEQIEKAKKEIPDKHGYSRNAVLHTLYRMENYEDINAADMEEGDRKFLELTKTLWKELTVHEDPDLDAKSCLKLMALFGIDLDKITLNYVPKGQTVESGIVMDTSGRHGVIADGEGKRLTFDHHGEESDRSTSATKLVYETLVELKFIKKEAYLDRFVEFVTRCDNLDFAPDEAAIYKNYHENMYGLAAKMEIDDILDLMKKGIDPKASLPMDFLLKHTFTYPDTGVKETLAAHSAKMKTQMGYGEKEARNMEKNGFVLDTGDDRFGKVLVDTMKKADKDKWYNKVNGMGPSRQLTVFAQGYGAYVVWSPEEKKFFAYTKKRMDEDSVPGGFSQGEIIRGHMLICGDLHHGQVGPEFLEEILGKLSGKADFKPEGELKKALAVDLAGKDVLRLIDSGSLTETEMRCIMKARGVSAKNLIYEIMPQRSNSKEGKALSKAFDRKKRALTKEEQKNVKKIENIVITVLLEYQRVITVNPQFLASQEDPKLEMPEPAGQAEQFSPTSTQSEPISKPAQVLLKPEPPVNLPISSEKTEETILGLERRDWQEVKRETEVMAVEDLAGSMDAFAEHVKKLGVARKDAHGKWKWTGRDAKLVFLGDILGDYGLDGIEITNTIFNLADQAEKAGGQVDFLCGNHDLEFIRFLTSNCDAQEVSDNAGNYFGGLHTGVLELADFDSDPRSKKAKLLLEDGIKQGNRWFLNDKYEPAIQEIVINYYARMPIILSDMQKDRQGKKVLENICRMKVVSFHDDTLFFHIDPDSYMVEEIIKTGNVPQKVDEINRIFQDNLRSALLQGGKFDSEFKKIRDTFLWTNTRTYFTESYALDSFVAVTDKLIEKGYWKWSPGVSGKNWGRDEERDVIHYVSGYIDTDSIRSDGELKKILTGLQGEMAFIDESFKEKFIGFVRMNRENRISESNAIVDEIISSINDFAQKNKVVEKMIGNVRDTGINAIVHGHSPRVDRYFDQGDFQIISPHARFKGNSNNGTLTVRKDGKMDLGGNVFFRESVPPTAAKKKRVELLQNQQNKETPEEYQEIFSNFKTQMDKAGVNHEAQKNVFELLKKVVGRKDVSEKNKNKLLGVQLLFLIDDKAAFSDKIGEIRVDQDKIVIGFGRIKEESPSDKEIESLFVRWHLKQL